MPLQNKLNRLLLATVLSFASTVAIAEVVEVEIYKYQFIPQEITIKKGDTVRWINKEKRQYHSVWFEQLGEKEGEYFWPEETFERTFQETGNFPYRCGPHPQMTATVRVQD